jgi:uncharacterized protein (TIGR02996 family)
VWEPVALPELPGRVLAVSEPVVGGLIVWTSEGIFLVKLDPAARVQEGIASRHGATRLDPADGCFRWRGLRYRMHGECGPGGTVVGTALPAAQRAGQTIQYEGGRLLVRDIAGAVRHAIEGHEAKVPWSVAGFCGANGEYLLVAHPGLVRLYRYVGSPEGGGALWQREGDPARQESFVAAINDAPDDDTPRLVYADWLDEHGDSDRAAFIRLQCRLAEREQVADVPFDDPDQQRVVQLLQAHEARWTAELPALHGVHYALRQAFRGFPAVRFRNPADLIRHAGSVRTATPTEAVVFGTLPRTHLARLLKTPLPERICRLTAWNPLPGSEPALADWLTSLQAARLRQIHIKNCAGWTALLRAVAESHHLTRLEALKTDTFFPVPPKEDVVLALARSPHLPRLRLVSSGFWFTYPEATKAELRQRFPAVRLK